MQATWWDEEKAIPTWYSSWRPKWHFIRCPLFSRTVTCLSKIDGQEQGQIAWHLFPQLHYWNAWDTEPVPQSWVVLLMAGSVSSVIKGCRAWHESWSQSSQLDTWIFKLREAASSLLWDFSFIYPLGWRYCTSRKSDPLGDMFMVCFVNVWWTWVQMTTVCECNVRALSFWLPNHMTIPPRTNSCGILLMLWVL